MLSQKQRISREDFTELLQKSRFVQGNFCTARIHRKSNNDELSQFAFVVSKKVAPRAVDRNFLRREGYRLVQENKDSFKKGYRIALFFKKGALQADSAERRKDMQDVFQKAGVYA